jgi:hypothetical protein
MTLVCFRGMRRPSGHGEVEKERTGRAVLTERSDFCDEKRGAVFTGGRRSIRHPAHKVQDGFFVIYRSPRFNNIRYRVEMST